MLNCFNKQKPTKLVVKDNYSNYVLDVQKHQSALAKLDKRFDRRGQQTFGVTLIPDLNVEPPVVRVSIEKKNVGFLRNNVGYRYLKEIGNVKTTCSGRFQNKQTQDDGSKVEFGVLLNCKTPFSVSNGTNNEDTVHNHLNVMSRLFQQSPLDNI